MVMAECSAHSSLQADSKKIKFAGSHMALTDCYREHPSELSHRASCWKR